MAEHDDFDFLDSLSVPADFDFQDLVSGGAPESQGDHNSL